MERYRGIGIEAYIHIFTFFAEYTLDGSIH